MRNKILLLFVFIFSITESYAQPCTTLGQTPSTAFPVCGTTTFQQSVVPLCSTNDLYVPGCSANGGPSYQNRNPFFYKFTCYVAGTLGFIIRPDAANEDYDWQLYDITGHNPDDIFTVNSLVVTGNWSGSYGNTGATAGGAATIQCGSAPTDGVPTFAQMPTLIAGHQYLLMISHFTDTQSGYSLSFGAGTAVITDPLPPHLSTATTSCDGTKLTVKLNKRMKCSSLTAGGSEFSLLPAVTTVIAAVAPDCSAGFDFDSVILTLASPLPSGSYQLVINDGTDNNTLLDNCDRTIPVNEQVPFQYIIPQPILADSVGTPPCTPDSILVYYPKKIQCSTVSPGGSDFSITGSTPVTIIGAYGNCVNDLSNYIVIKLSSPIYTQGNYTLLIRPGIDGSPIYDLCGQPILPQTLSFSTADTVNAGFSYTNAAGCRQDTLSFSHNGANGVTSWNWIFNNGTPVTTSSNTVIFPASSTNTVQLIVSNSVCRDTSTQTIALDNEVKAAFTIPGIICPEDSLTISNTSTGQVSLWQWTYNNTLFSSLQDPLPFLFPFNNRETIYLIKLVASNTTLHCSDSTTQSIKVLDNCYIGVPTAFTPNGDGLNDYFWPHNAIKADNLDFKVFNRWGQMVFHSKNWQQKWDGTLKGIPQGSGTYVWMLQYSNRDTGKTVFQKGTVVLIR